MTSFSDISSKCVSMRLQRVSESMRVARIVGKNFRDVLSVNPSCNIIHLQLHHNTIVKMKKRKKSNTLFNRLDYLRMVDGFHGVEAIRDNVEGAMRVLDFADIQQISDNCLIDGIL